jgi:glutamine phosphoribosylpyrophosphate amidotransferase
MCGIVAYTGVTKPNWQALKLAVIYQKHRGTDGIGFVTNNLRLTGSYEGYQKDFADPLNFFKANFFPWLYNKKFENNTTIIHNRARSKGIVTKEQIHPWVYTTHKEDGTEITHFFAHNGTLQNEDDLLKEYGYDPKDFKTDSHALGQLIVDKGFEEILPKYIGAAAFVYFRTDEPNVI